MTADAPGTAGPPGTAGSPGSPGSPGTADRPAPATGTARSISLRRPLLRAVELLASAARRRAPDLVRRARDRLSVVTRTGWLCLVLLALSAWAAARLGWQEARAGAGVLALVVVTAGLWLIPRRAHAVTHELLEPRVTVGDDAVIHVRVANPTARTLLPVRMEMPVGPVEAVFAVPTLAPGAVDERGFVLPTSRRGIVTVGPVVSVASDPVGLVRLTRERTESQEVHIHPRTIRLGSVLSGLMRDVEGAVTQELSSSDVAFHALRDYVPGDDRRNVHWRSTARTGRLMVRQFEETRRAHLLVILDLDEAAYETDEELETAISCAASLIVATMREGREVSLVTQAGAPPLTTAVRALDALTTLKAVADQEDLARLTRRAVAAVPQASVTALLTGSRTPAERIHRARVELPVSTQPLALRVDAAASLHSTPIAGLRVLTVPRLDALPRAMRRAVR